MFTLQYLFKCNQISPISKVKQKRFFFLLITIGYRSLWPDDFGDEHNEIDVALTILYESLKKTHTTASMFDDKYRKNIVSTYCFFHLDLLVILQQGRPISDVCHRLYEQNLKILSSTPDPL